MSKAASLREKMVRDVKMEGLRTILKAMPWRYLPDKAFTAAHTAGEDLSVPLSVRS
jgi:hypothetical protein